MSCCAASGRAGGSAGGQSRTTATLLTDLKLVFWCKPLWKNKKGATSSSIWSVWTECLTCPNEHTVRCACPCQKTQFFFLSHIFVVNSHCISVLCLFAASACHLNRSHMMIIEVSSGYLWIHCHYELQEENTHQCCHVKKTEKRMQPIRKPPRVRLSSNIPVGHQMMWD